MNGRLIIIGVLIVLAIIVPFLCYFTIELPANIEYQKKFGADVTMATEGSTTLTGINSIQDYVNCIWRNMNETFQERDYGTTYNSIWYWAQTPDNTLAKQNEYFNSLNESITRRQAWVDSVIEHGGYVGGDPVQTAINQTRVEMKLYGGLDWALRGAWYIQFAYTDVVWGYYMIVVWVILLLVGIAVIILPEPPAIEFT